MFFVLDFVFGFWGFFIIGQARQLIWLFYSLVFSKVGSPDVPSNPDNSVILWVFLCFRWLLSPLPMWWLNLLLPSQGV